MYILLIFGLIALSECRWENKHNGFGFGRTRGYEKPKVLRKKDCCVEDPTQNIVDYLKAADEIVRTFCTDDYNAREVFDFEVYRLKYTFERAIEDAMTINIRYRVVHLNVKLVNGVEVTDMRILPPGLNTSDAVWRLDGDELIVTIPYKHNSEVEIPISSDKEEEDKLINVPLGPEYEVHSYFKEGFVNPSLVEIN
ncbi:unnamed protein product [Colias eurytheme]|nr:unnamed protein product [Colias eurytheme]